MILVLVINMKAPFKYPNLYLPCSPEVTAQIPAVLILWIYFPEQILFYTKKPVFHQPTLNCIKTTASTISH